MLRSQDFVNNKLEFSNKKLEIWDMLCVKNYDINAYNGSEFLGNKLEFLRSVRIMRK